MGRVIFDNSKVKGEIEVWEGDHLLGIASFDEHCVEVITVSIKCKPDKVVFRQDGYPKKVTGWNGPPCYEGDSININIYSHSAEMDLSYLGG